MHDIFFEKACNTTTHLSLPALLKYTLFIKIRTEIKSRIAEKAAAQQHYKQWKLTNKIYPLKIAGKNVDVWNILLTLNETETTFHLFGSFLLLNGFIIRISLLVTAPNPFPSLISVQATRGSCILTLAPCILCWALFYLVSSSVSTLALIPSWVLGWLETTGGTFGLLPCSWRMHVSTAPPLSVV